MGWERVCLLVAVLAATLLGSASAMAAPPTVTITTPEDGASYVVGQSVEVQFACEDVDGDPLTCVGKIGEDDIASGDLLPTDAVAIDQTLTVTADDGVEPDPVTESVTYSVRAAGCADTTESAYGGVPTWIDVACGGALEAPDAELVVTSGPQEGTAEPDTEGSRIRYTPDAAFTGEDTFTYVVRTPEGDSMPATATVDVSAAPVTCDDVPDAQVSRNGTVTVTPPCVGPWDSIAIVTDPPAGSAEVDPDTGAITYEAPGDHVGPVELAYAATDDDEPFTTPPATVTIEVGPCADRSATVPFFALIQIDCGDALTEDDAVLKILTQPQHGDIPDGGVQGDTVLYLSNGYVGPDSFTFYVESPDGDSVPATVTIDAQPFAGGGGGGGGGDIGGGGGGPVGNWEDGIVPWPDEPPYEGLPAIPFLPSLGGGSGAGRGSGNLPTRFEKSTAVKLRGATVRTNRKGRVRLKIRNANAFPVTGNLVVKGAFRKNKRGKRVPRLRIRVPELTIDARKTLTVRSRLGRGERRLLQRKRKLRVVAVLRVRDVEGTRRTVRHRMTLRAPKRKR